MTGGPASDAASGAEGPSLRVLMLGWEFPPHISGGLGTACLGLSRGLAEQGVDVTFVVPRVFGDEDVEGVQLVAASDVPVPSFAAGDSGGGGGGASPSGGAVDARVPVRLRHAFSGARADRRPTGADAGRLSDDRALAEQMTRTMQLLSVDSPLRPYMTEGDYAAKMLELERLKRLTAERAAAVLTPAASDEALAAPSAASAPPTEHLPFEGGYGPDLLAEVQRYARVVRELASRHEFDVVHAHDWMTYPAGIAAAEASGRPLVAHLHACEYDRSGDRPDPSVLAVEQEGFTHADRIVAVSEYTAAMLRRHYDIDESKLRVVHNAVTRREQAEQLKLARTVEEPIVLFLGRITYQKGPDYFLEAAARVVRVLPDVRFVVSGTGDMWPKTIERAAQLGIAANTHFTGFLGGEDVERMFAMADLYVMPSVSEPFGISPLEAMALDVPVIVSRQSGVAEVLENALKVDFWDVEDLANKMIALLSYPALRDELSAAGRAEVGAMTWNERGRSLLGVYRELMP